MGGRIAEHLAEPIDLLARADLFRRGFDAHAIVRDEPVATTPTLPTFQSKPVVGLMVFAPDYFGPTAKQPVNLLTTLRFKQGSPPRTDWIGRGYFPATLNEVRASLQQPTRNYKVVDVVYLKGEGVPNGEDVIRIKSSIPADGWSWTTMVFDGGKQLIEHLTKLTPGAYEITVWQQLEYERRIVNQATKRAEWHPRHVALTKGTLPIIIDP